MTRTRTFPVVDGDKAKRIFAEQIRPTLTEADRGRYVTINEDTGEFEIDDDDLAGSLRARRRFGKDAPLFMLRAGYIAPYTMGFAEEDNRLEEW